MTLHTVECHSAECHYVRSQGASRLLANLECSKTNRPMQQFKQRPYNYIQINAKLGFEFNFEQKQGILTEVEEGSVQFTSSL